MTGPETLARLDEGLATFEASRRKTATGVGGDAGIGYRLLGQILGGVLGGLGLGWVFDHFARTSPWGLIIGLLVGAAISIYSTVRMAAQMSAPAVSGTSDEVLNKTEGGHHDP